MKTLPSFAIVESRRAIAAAAAAALLAPALVFAQPQHTTGPALALAAKQARYDAARDDYEVGRFQVAFDAFAQLADEGHCDASRMAQQMLRHGRLLYATEFAVAPERLARWRALPCPATLAAR
jgi:hypothetical protein